MMPSNVMDLVKILDKETQIYESLTEIARLKKDIILKNRIKELDMITQKEQAYIKAVVQLEKQRTEILKRIMKEKNIKIETITELYNHLDEQDSRRLLDVQEKLQKNIFDLSNANKTNSDLINQSLEFIELNLELADFVESSGINYGDDASDKRIKGKRNLFDAKG